MEKGYSSEVLKNLVDGKLGWETLKNIMSSPKDDDRFGKILEIEQEKVSWEDEIVIALAEHLYVVRRGSDYLVKCICGYEFGDYKENWKLNALVYERDPQDGEIFVARRASDPDWMILREFYCPGCQAQLEVEAVPPGYPFVFDFQPNLDVLKNR